MSSREKILLSIAANKPAELLLSEVPLFEGDSSLLKFQKILESIGGRFMQCATLKEAETIIKSNFPDASKIASNIIPGTVEIGSNTSAKTLEQVDLAVLHGELGVAENGAVWLPERNMINRALPFITQHLILLLDKGKIVPTLHQAYASIDPSQAYGVFIAGPSKTADIEQSLVIGAHGARTMTVIVY